MENTLRTPWKGEKTHYDESLFYVCNCDDEPITVDCTKEEAMLIISAPGLQAKLDQANKTILIAAKHAYYNEIIDTLMVDHTEESPEEWTESRIDEWREQAIAAIEAAKESE